VQGDNKIRIETAESIEDAKKNNFRDGEFSRYFVNDKPVQSYMTFIRFIAEETKKSKNTLIPDGKKIESLRQEMLKNQNDSMRKGLEDIRRQYGSAGAPDSVMKEIDDMIKKIDQYGVRIVK
jgi:hypothetical protein